MSDDVYVKQKEIQKKIGCSGSALRRWAEAGQIKSLKTPGGHRLYGYHSVEQLVGLKPTSESKPPIQKEEVIYARVSSLKQKPDLERQIQWLQSKYPGARVVQDIASGINFERRGLQQLLVQAHQGKLSKIIIAQRDRLARFAYSLLEFIFRQYEVEVSVLGKNASTLTTEQELCEDLLAITTSFVAKNNGRRAAFYRKQRRESTDEESQDGDSTRGNKRKRTGANDSREPTSAQVPQNPSVSNPGTTDPFETLVRLHS